MKKAMRDRLLATTIIAGAATLSAPAFAQATGPVEGQSPSVVATPASAATPASGSEIVVTGSRIPQPNLTSVAPVTVVNAADLKLQGTTRVEDILNSLPQVFAGQSNGISNGATGTATVDLRGLGQVRTLVLINGRRLLPGDPTSSAADLNNIPASLIKRVDVLTGGASATYGADAVAGVVNFIMDTNYTGFKIDGQYSLYQHQNGTNDGLIPALQARNFGYPTGNSADGGTVDVTATFGVGFDDNRGHIVAYGGYRKVNAVTQAARDYSACTSQINTANKLTCGGSATSANGTIFDAASNTYQIGPGRTIQPGFTPYNFAPTNYYQRPDERYTAGFFAHYDVSDAIKPYMEAMFMDDRSVAQIAASGDFGNTLTVNCDNPNYLGGTANANSLYNHLCDPGGPGRAGNLINGSVGPVPIGGLVDANGNPLPATQFIDPVTGAIYNKGAAQILRRNVEGGARRDDLQHTSYRGVIGVKGDLDDAWSYDAYYQYGRTNFAETYTNDFSIARLNKALDVVNVNGVNECRSVEDGSDLNCVPYDIFGGNPSQAAINYLSTPGFQRAQITEQVASFNLTGQLGKYGVKSPWANDGVAINIGAEYRKEALNLQTDEEFSTGDLSGQGAATLPVQGSYNVKEVFGELSVPIVQQGFFYNLSFDGGYRYSHYSTSDGNTYNTNTFKLGVEFAPIKDVLIRASYNRAARAPNIQELFAPQHVALDGSNDPCSGETPDATAAQCALTGVTAAQYGNISANPAAQYNGFVGGNPNLKPEKSTTKSIGIVLQPHWIPRLAISVDYYDINVKNAIQTFGEDTILNACTANGDPSICGLIHRDAKGSLWLTPTGYVVDLPHNIGGLRTKGLDVNASYSHEIGSLGSLSASIVGTYTDKFVVDNGISPIYDCAGLYGTTCGNPRPKWRHKARLTYTAPNGLGFSAQWRYVGHVALDRAQDNDSLSGAYAPHDARIGAKSYFDLALTARFGDHYNFRLGMDNILDKEPPIISANGSASACQGIYCNGNTYPGVYDALGRYIYAGFSLEF